MINILLNVITQNMDLKFIQQFPTELTYPLSAIYCALLATKWKNDEEYYW